MKIEIPNNNLNERKYIIDVLLGEFLGLEYSIETGKSNDCYKISSNDNKIIIEDHLFSKYPNGDYLQKEAIPQQISTSNNPYCPEDDIIILFGDEKFEQDESKNTIRLGADIFASSFFMLTRWEEYVNKVRDEHNRFPAKESIAFKNQFLHRPIVNEYTELLWKMLEYCGISQKRKKHNFAIIPTHDIDHFTKYNSHIRTMGGDLLVRKSLNAFVRTSKNFLTARNPNDSFDLIMDLSEKSGLQSRFYFMAANTNQQYDYEDYIEHKLYIKTIKKITDRGHIIGLHSGYDSYNNTQVFNNEKSKLERSIDIPITEGRQHYLRFEVPETWRIWDDNNLTLDSSMYYSEKEGFRCGVCYDFKVFDIITKKQLNLTERPLIIMEVTLLSYHNNTIDEITSNVLDLAKTVKKYNGNLVLLWHNSAFYNYPYNKIRGVYNELIELR